MRVVAFIDGFNLYHAIHRLRDNRLKWCDVRALMNLFMDPGDELIAVRFYTAFPWHIIGKDAHGARRRWRTYTDALAAKGGEIIKGQFKEKTVRVDFDRLDMPDDLVLPDSLRGRKAHLKKYEEKETDVNIALDILDLAYRNEFDKCFLLSGDSDIIPAITRMLKRFPDKRAVTFAPPKQRPYRFHALAAKEFRGRFFPFNIHRAHIVKCRLPDEVEGEDGKFISAPVEYR